jgi:hypothetical protein
VERPEVVGPRGVEDYEQDVRPFARTHGGRI